MEHMKNAIIGFGALLQILDNFVDFHLVDFSFNLWQMLSAMCEIAKKCTNYFWFASQIQLSHIKNSNRSTFKTLPSGGSYFEVNYLQKLNCTGLTSKSLD